MPLLYMFFLFFLLPSIQVQPNLGISDSNLRAMDGTVVVVFWVFYFDIFALPGCTNKCDVLV